MPPSLSRRHISKIKNYFCLLSHCWLAIPQLVLHADWHDVWHSPQPPFLAELQRFFVSIVLIRFMVYTSYEFVRFIITRFSLQVNNFIDKSQKMYNVKRKNPVLVWEQDFWWGWVGSNHRPLACQARLTALRYDFHSIFLAFHNHYFGFSSKLLTHKSRTNKPITV